MGIASSYLKRSSDTTRLSAELKTAFGSAYHNCFTASDIAKLVASGCHCLKDVRWAVMARDANGFGLTQQCLVQLKAHFCDDVIFWVKSGRHAHAVVPKGGKIDTQDVAEFYGFLHGRFCMNNEVVTNDNFVQLVSKVRMQPGQALLGDHKQPPIPITGTSLAMPNRMPVDRWLDQAIGDLPGLHRTCLSPYQTVTYKGGLTCSLEPWVELQSNMKLFLGKVKVHHSAGTRDEDELEFRDRLMYCYLAHVNHVLRSLGCDVRYRAAGYARPASFSDVTLAFDGNPDPSSLSVRVLGVGNVFMGLPRNRTLKEALKDRQSGAELTAALKQVFGNAVLEGTRLMFLINTRVMFVLKRSSRSSSLKVSPPIYLNGSGEMKPLAVLTYLAVYAEELFNRRLTATRVPTTASGENDVPVTIADANDMNTTSVFVNASDVSITEARGINMPVATAAANDHHVDGRESMEASGMSEVASSQVISQQQQLGSCNNNKPPTTKPAAEDVYPVSNSTSALGSDEGGATANSSTMHVDVSEALQQSKKWLENSTRGALYDLDQLPLMTSEMLGYTDCCLGGGYHTRVFKGEFDSKPVVLKLYNNRHRFGLEDFKNEVTAYLSLPSLQGTCIAQLLAVCRLYETGALVLVLERPTVFQKYTPADRDSAISSLNQLHALGVVHGDLQEDDLLVCEGRVMLTGLQYCRFDVNEEDQQAEMSKLGRIGCTGIPNGPVPMEAITRDHNSNKRSNNNHDNNPTKKHRSQTDSSGQHLITISDEARLTQLRAKPLPKLTQADRKLLQEYGLCCRCRTHKAGHAQPCQEVCQGQQ